MEESVREDLIYKTSLILKRLDEAFVSIKNARDVLDDEWGTRSAREDLDLLCQQVDTAIQYAKALANRQARLLEYSQD